MIKMWQGPALVDGLFGGIGGVDWNHSDSQRKVDALGILSNMMHIGGDIAMYVSCGTQHPFQVANVMSQDRSNMMHSE
jgi:hypothetical protein